MDETEVEIVAEELAKLGGTAWYPGREQGGPVLRVVHERYRDRARAAIAALDRYRAEKNRPYGAPALDPRVHELNEVASTPNLPPSDQIEVGATVVFRPPGDRRAYPCIVEKITEGHVYLIPQDRTGISWVYATGSAELTEAPRPRKEEPTVKDS
ncbi:hypothetical protein [Microvirga alba]|uniref:Uncharacterized protein n=1 Tax=Microvirga alba TaxID=2791025 RepID=A0A931BP91_9HYPH|nr:hypothetical protein [Microvirga alba]MBF9233533.1 hypothetical protein [Microvirga alba]